MATVVACLPLATATHASAGPGGAEAGKRGAKVVQFAYVKSAMRSQGGNHRPGLCVEGKWPRGTRVILASVSDGKRCAMASAEYAVPIPEGADCSALDGACDIRGLPLLAIIGSGEIEVRPARPEELRGDERTRAAQSAARALPRDPPREGCTNEPIDILDPPRTFLRPFGPGSPIVLVGFGARAAGIDGDGPVVAITPKGVKVPWGFFTLPVWAFHVDGRPYLWAAETGAGCGLRRDTIYAVEGDQLRAVLRSGFLGD